MKDLKSLDQTIYHSMWGFIPETSMQKWTITFDEQDVMSLEEIDNIIFVMVYPDASNPIENIRNGYKIVPRIFYDYTSKYLTIQWDKKQGTPEEIIRFINAYLSKDWALMLVNLNSSIQVITKEGFIGSRILTLDGNG